MELDREQIMKALECCGVEGHICGKCPYESVRIGISCRDKMSIDSLAIIREQDERIAAFVIMLNKAYELCKKAKADTVREMQDRFSMILDVGEEVDTDRAVDFLAAIAKEMLEEAK